MIDIPFQKKVEDALQERVDRYSDEDHGRVTTDLASENFNESQDFRSPATGAAFRNTLSLEKAF